jgi:hypothetical protein
LVDNPLVLQAPAPLQYPSGPVFTQLPEQPLYDEAHWLQISSELVWYTDVALEPVHFLQVPGLSEGNLNFPVVVLQQSPPVH